VSGTGTSKPDSRKPSLTSSTSSPGANTSFGSGTCPAESSSHSPASDVVRSESLTSSSHSPSGSGPSGLASTSFKIKWRRAGAVLTVTRNVVS
jgi:hypothetical protein